MDLTTIALLAGGGIVLLLGAFFFLRPRAPKEAKVLHFNCPGCKRRLGYQPRQAGHTGICPRCGKSLRFPKED